MTGFDSKREAAKAKLNDDDDTQVYADTLLIVYQRGFADGKRTANAMHDLARLGQEIEQEQVEQCIGKDPRCPCQDGGACHYKDCGSTKARPVAQPEQEPVAFAAEIVEDVNGVLSTQWADWWIPNEGDKLYTTPPAAQPEQQAEPFSAVSIPATVTAWKMGYEAAKAEMQPEQEPVAFINPPGPITQYSIPTQRQWVGLTDEEITEIYEMGLGVRASIETALDKLEERNT